MSGRCLWCGSPFTVRKVGAHAKKFCSVPCKDHYHSSARRGVQRAITDGQLSVHDLKALDASCTTAGEAKER